LLHWPGVAKSPNRRNLAACFYQEMNPVRNTSTVLPVRCPSLYVAGIAAGTAMRAAGLPVTGPDAVVAVRDPWGGVRDLAWVPDTAVEVEPVAASTVEGRGVVMRSAGHVLAQAVQRLCHNARLGRGGEAGKDGFAYDFDVPHPFTPEILADVERLMTLIIGERQRFVRREVDPAAATREFAAEPHRLHLVDLLRGNADRLTIYDNVDPRSGERVWSDLCGGPHVPTTGDIPALKLTHSTAVRAHGLRLQRVHGTYAD
jgi:threonyl-tRNA synthetase